MSATNPSRVYEVFVAVRDLPEADRSENLQRLCGGNPELRHEVESLLGYVVDPRDFLGCGSTEDSESPSPASLVGLPARIGQYDIVGKAAEGGMGIVYEAMQDSPRRRVALKVLRPMLTAASIRQRFEYEAAVLGRLRHPGIAHIYEAGTFDLGAGPQLFLAMEFVDGLPLTAWATRERLNVRDRVLLMAKVSEAVRHAHQHGVIHRDLKPDNIVVGNDGQPRVLDFGIACATDTEEHDERHTRSGEAIGTPAYMSPEQIAGRRAEMAITTDVYSLGVICYEVLAGVLPHDLHHKSIAEAATLVNEHRPASLSTIDRELRGDVEIMVEKALETDRTRRYQSAAELASDLRRFLRDEPILARSPSAFYQAQRFVRRHKAMVAGITIAMLAILGGGIVATVAAINLTEQRRVTTAYAYRVGIRAAVDALDKGRWTIARSFLDGAPVAARGWEWHHVAGRFKSWDEELSTGGVMTSAPHYTPDGRRLVAVLADGTIGSWDLASGNMTRPFPVDGRVVTLATSAPTCEPRIAAGTDDGRIFVWRLDSSEPPSILRGSRGQIHCLAWSLQGDLLSTDDKSLRRWTGARVDAGTVAEAAGTQRLVVHPDGNHVAAVCSYNRVRLWRTGSDGPLEYHSPKVPRDLIFTADGRHLVVTTQYQNLQLARHGDPAPHR